MESLIIHAAIESKKLPDPSTYLNIPILIFVLILLLLSVFLTDLFRINSGGN